MKDEKLHQAEWQTGQEPAQKQPYEPPKATFVPLELEERLLGCYKLSGLNDLCWDSDWPHQSGTPRLS